MVIHHLTLKDIEDGTGYSTLLFKRPIFLPADPTRHHGESVEAIFTVQALYPFHLIITEMVTSFNPTRVPTSFNKTTIQ